jgi:hypothetical protein
MVNSGNSVARSYKHPADTEEAATMMSSIAALLYFHHYESRVVSLSLAIREG